MVDPINWSCDVATPKENEMNRSIFINKKSKAIIANHGGKVMYCAGQALLSLLTTFMVRDVHVETEADIRVFGEGDLPRLHLAIQARSQNANVINRSRRCRRPVVDVLAAAFGLNHEEPEDLEVLQGLMMLAVGWCMLDPKGDHILGVGHKLAKWKDTMGVLFQHPEDNTIPFLREVLDRDALFEAIDRASIPVVTETLISRVPVDHIDADGTNFRDDPGDINSFSDDIRRNGLVHPITVTPQRNGRFAVLTGERRLLALKKAGYKVLDVIIDSPSADMVTLRRLSENCQSKKNDHLELAKAYDMALHEKRGLDPNFSQKDLAEAVQVDVTRMSKYMKLNSIPAEYHDSIRHLDMEKLLIIAGADTEEERQRLIDIALKGATVAKMRSAGQKSRTRKAGFRQKMAHEGISVVLTTKENAPTKEKIEAAFKSILQQMFPEG